MRWPLTWGMMPTRREPSTGNWRERTMDKGASRPVGSRSWRTELSLRGWQMDCVVGETTNEWPMR